ncbi:MAG: nodulation protein NfeD [Hyphomicrobiaceae bacterium]|jgi:membrane-bound serine protease (ClpP class)
MMKAGDGRKFWMSAMRPSLSARARWGWLRLVMALVYLLGGLALVAIGPSIGQQANNGPVLVFDVKGVIGFTSADYLKRAVQRAQDENASLIIMRIDTPGGLVSSTREMIQTILASPIPIVGYVAPSGARAASAGTYLMYASHLAAMAPATHLGAATPIQMGAPGTTPPTQPSKDEKNDDGQAGAAERKLMNDAVAYLRGLAELRNRNADWAEKAVREGATLTANQALQENVIEIVAPDLRELLAAVDGRSVTTSAGPVTLATRDKPIIQVDPSWHIQVLQVIADPNVAFILLLIGIYGILFELLNPGAIFPGVIGGISLVLALTALTVLPTNLGGVALLLLGIALLAGEAFTPGFGIMGIGGIVAFILGGLFLFDPDQVDIDFSVSTPLIIGAAIASAGILAGVLGVAVRSRQREVRTGAEQLIGSSGEVVQWSGQTGRVRVHGETWGARSGSVLLEGDPVVVTDREGLTLIVKPKR